MVHYGRVLEVAAFAGLCCAYTVGTREVGARAIISRGLLGATVGSSGLQWAAVGRG